MTKQAINFLGVLFMLGLVSAQPARASISVEGVYSTSAIFNLALLICAVICLIWSLKILSLVRGGLISKSWQMFVLGFCFLILAQLLIVGGKVGLFFIPAYIKTALYFFMTMTWLIGLYQTRRVLG